MFRICSILTTSTTANSVGAPPCPKNKAVTSYHLSSILSLDSQGDPTPTVARKMFSEYKLGHVPHLLKAILRLPIFLSMKSDTLPPLVKPCLLWPPFIEPNLLPAV